MKNSIIRISTVVLICLIVILTGFSVADVLVPGTAGVVKPPDVSVPSTLPSPSLVTPVGPVSPISGSPVQKQAPGIVQSPVMGGASSNSSEITESTVEVSGSHLSSLDIEEMVSRPHAPDRIIVRYKTEAGLSKSEVEKSAEQMNEAYGAKVLMTEDDLGISGIQVLQLPSDLSVQKAISLYSMSPVIQYIQPDYIYHKTEFTWPKINPPSISSPIAGSSEGTEPLLINGPQSMNPPRSDYGPIPGDNYTSTTGVDTMDHDTAWSGSENNTYSIQATPNDPRYGNLWGMTKISAPQAWDITTGSSSVIVAVLDTGVDYNHVDLTGNVDKTHGYDFAYNDPIPDDVDEHGTHCAGTIGAVGNNGIGVVGVAWQVTILPVKVLDNYGSGYDSWIASGIYHSRNNGASIVSMSLGGYGESPVLEEAIRNSPHVLFVCAAGNDNRDTDVYHLPHVPSGINLPNIISVAATDSDDNKADFSNYGATTVDLAAPGVSILSNVPGNGYASWGGTSMATPHVAGVAALMKAANPHLSVAEIKSAIMETSEPKSSLSGKCVSGGRVNAYQAVAQVNPSTLLAKFYGVPGVEVLPLTIQFYDVSEGQVSSRLWNFGDGTTESIQDPVKVYENPGTYTVQLTVSDGFSSSSTETTMISGFMD